MRTLPKDFSFSPVGMSVDTAAKLLETVMISCRLVRRGSIHYIVTQDYNTNRINLEANEEGYVESFYRG